MSHRRGGDDGVLCVCDDEFPLMTPTPSAPLDDADGVADGGGSAPKTVRMVLRLEVCREGRGDAEVVGRVTEGSRLFS
jgi:hypothetical protein